MSRNPHCFQTLDNHYITYVTVGNYCLLRFYDRGGVRCVQQFNLRKNLCLFCFCPRHHALTLAYINRRLTQNINDPNLFTRLEAADKEKQCKKIFVASIKPYIYMHLAGIIACPQFFTWYRSGTNHVFTYDPRTNVLVCIIEHYGAYCSIFFRAKNQSKILAIYSKKFGDHPVQILIWHQLFFSGENSKIDCHFYRDPKTGHLAHISSLIHTDARDKKSHFDYFPKYESHLTSNFQVESLFFSCQKCIIRNKIDFSIFPQHSLAEELIHLQNISRKINSC